MKTFAQIYRQTIKSSIGIIMMALSTIVLCVGIGQSQAAKTTAAMLTDRFDTVAVMSAEALINEEVIYDSRFVSVLNIERGENTGKWAMEAAADHPDLVKMVSQNGLASAYIRNLTPVSYYTNSYYNFFGWTGLSGVMALPYETPYNFAMFEIVLNEIGQPQALQATYSVETVRSQTEFSDYQLWLDYTNGLETISATTCYTAELYGRITRVLSLEESFKDPIGMTLRFSLTAKTLEELENVLAELEVGAQHLVYGTNYYDDDWALRQEKGIVEWDFSKLRLVTDKEKELWKQNAKRDVYAVYGGDYLTEYQYRHVNSVSLTVTCTAYSRMKYECIRDNAGYLQEIRENTDRTLTNADGESVTVSAEVFGEYYKIPSIVLLDGTAEEFLGSEAGEAWRAALGRDAVNNHTFPVMGVDNLGYVAQFALGESKIVEGREFSKQELASGAAVCVISQELAVANSLSVGDIIHPNFYNVDENLPYQASLAEQNGLINPAAGFYFWTTPLLGELEYTIVGIYRSNEPWAYVTNDQNHYAFTPNTIFVPKKSIPSKMQYSSLLQFQTIVLHNGCLDKFSDLMNRSGFAGAYLLDDQGYSVIARNFSDYQVLSRRVMEVCLAAHAMIALLYLLLFPGSQGKTMKLMEILGASPHQRCRHVLMGSLTLLIPATIVGTVAGFFLWEGIVAQMKLHTGVLLEMEVDRRVLLTVAFAQLVLMAVLSAIVSAFQARPFKLSKRR